jgi:DNA-directed RNA polymerase subunit RPC12/RpoP
MIKEFKKYYSEIKNEENDNGGSTKKVKCPVCTNKRLFDVINAYQAEIEIKCNKCGSKIHITFDSNQINAIEI